MNALIPMRAAVNGQNIGRMETLMGLTARLVVGPDLTGGRFSMLEHRLAPRSLGAPLHTHSREDEFSCILEGRVGFQLGDEEFLAGPGDVVLKPRNSPHAFWNAGDEPVRIIEIISPGGFETYFAEMSKAFAGPQRDFARAAQICGEHGIEMRYETVPELMARHGLIG